MEEVERRGGSRKKEARNVVCVIRLDTRERKVYRDNIVIDN